MKELMEAQPGDAVELPEGMFALAEVTRYRATALAWDVWELAPEGEGATIVLAMVEGKPYRVEFTSCEAVPDNAEITINHMIFALQDSGDVRVESENRDGRHDFWLAEFRQYERQGRMLIFAEKHGDATLMTAEPMDEALVRVYQ